MTKITTGSGITARTIELQPFTREAKRAFYLSLGDGGFDARIAAIEAWAAPINAALEARGDEVKAPDTPEGYARRLLKLIGAVRGYIAEGDASRAARFAVDFGIVLEEMVMKRDWEHPALVGVGRARSAKRATDLTETQRIVRAALAAELWKESAAESRNTKKRRALVMGWLARDDGTDEGRPIGARTLDDYLSEARRLGLLGK